MASNQSALPDTPTLRRRRWACQSFRESLLQNTQPTAAVGLQKPSGQTTEAPGKCSRIPCARPPRLLERSGSLGGAYLHRTAALLAHLFHRMTEQGPLQHLDHGIASAARGHEQILKEFIAFLR